MLEVAEKVTVDAPAASPMTSPKQRVLVSSVQLYRCVWLYELTLLGLPVLASAVTKACTTMWPVAELADIDSAVPVPLAVAGVPVVAPAYETEFPAHAQIWLESVNAALTVCAPLGGDLSQNHST